MGSAAAVVCAADAAAVGTSFGQVGAGREQLGEGKGAAIASIAGMLAGAWVHDALRKRLGWARHSCID